MKRTSTTKIITPRGSALLLVLGMIVLVSALVLAFLASVSSELSSSKTYANGATVKQLADSATQLVMSQIVSGTGNTNSTLAWASQPGMIRTYDTSGNPAYFYKLYSAANMVTNGASGFSPAAESPPVTWDSANNAGIYTDLNSPVSSSGTNYFPIIDPQAYTGTTTTSVEGFTYSSAVDGVVQPSGGVATAGQRLPMPVMWLYVLQNGAIATPISGSSGTVTFDSTDPTKVPSSSNPIVGRVAFWTDDETCKVNINTASEGTFWDRPWAHTATEEKNSTSIPLQNEFQRYPGHPAKTCLSTVLDPILAAPNPSWYYGMPSATQTANSNSLIAYYGLVPRVSSGGTMGGSLDDTNSPTQSYALSPIAAKGDRLYTSPDELLYAPSYSSTTNTRQTNSAVMQANSGMTVALNNSYLEEAKFFLTAHSRAPEVNLFGKPRMTLWPLQLSAGLRNAKDGLIAFCSTINGKAYYFQRQSAYTAFGTACSSQDPTADWTMTDANNETRNQTLYNYLDQLTQQNIPGFGGSFGGSSGKYSTNIRRQILTEMFDMIRSGVNTYSTALSTPSTGTLGYTYAPQIGDSGEGQIVPLAPTTGTAAGTRGFGRFATITDAAIVFYRANGMTYQTTGTTNTITIPYTPTSATAVPQIAAVFFLQPYTVSPGLPPWSPNVHYVVTGLSQFSVSSPSHPSFTPLGFADGTGTATAPDNYACGRMCYSGAQNSTAGDTTAFLSFKAFLRYPGQQGAGLAGTDSTKVFGTSTSAAPNMANYPFYSTTTTGTVTGVPLGASGVADTTFNFSGSASNPIQIQIYSDNNGKLGTLLQTINMNFPAVNNLPMPTTAANNYLVSQGATYAEDSNYGMSSGRFGSGATGTTYQSKQFRQVLFEYQNDYAGTDTTGATVASQTMDVVRGVQPDPNGPAKGDLRVYAALPTVPANYFTTCTNYDSGTVPQTYPIVHALRDGAYAGSFGAGDPQYGWDITAAGAGGTPAINKPTYPYALKHTWQVSGNLVPVTYLASGTTSGTGSSTGTLQPEYCDGFNPAVPPGLNGAFQSGGALGDWDNMTGNLEDGPYINKPDEGDVDTYSNLANTAGDFRCATGAYSSGSYLGSVVNTITGGYFSRGLDRASGSPSDYRAISAATLSPNRQVCSAVMFGSLPTGIDPTGATAPKPWQTLLFCPNPPAGTSHPGFGSPSTGPPYTTPPDHLFLDLFTMPVVEPYAISEPLSTAGKVNMNYQILPFTYITRDTAVRAVLKSTRLMAIPTSASTENGATPAYKDGRPYPYECRYNINPDETAGTLAGFQARFSNGDIFRCASEICGIYLVPQFIPGASSSTFLYPPGTTVPTGSSAYGNTAAWWNNFRLTGDNAREFPYGDIYSRLTTKSNTYTVHIRVQTLKQALVPGSPASAWTQWREGSDLVTGEYRGSSLIERYVDTSDPTLPDFAQATSPSVEGYYKMRVVSSKKFAP